MEIAPDGSALIAQVCATLFVALAFTNSQTERDRPKAVSLFGVLLRLITSLLLLGLTVSSTFYATLDAPIKGRDLVVVLVTAIFTLLAFTVLIMDQLFAAMHPFASRGRSKP